MDELYYKIFNDLENGMSLRKASKKYGVAKSTIFDRYKIYKNSIKSLKKAYKNSVVDEKTFEPNIFITKKENNKKSDATLFLYDIHIPNESSEAISCAISYASINYNITRVVLGGDIMDCASLSKFDKTEDTKSFVYEVEQTKKFLSDLRIIFPHAEIVYLVGNHEERLEKYIFKHAPELFGVVGDLSYVLGLDKLNIRLIDNKKMMSKYGRFYSIDEFTVLHGHELGICPLISPAHKFLEKAKANLIVGHIHYPDEKVVSTIDNKILRCYSVGTLSKLNPAYRPFNGWGQGFCIMTHEDSHNIVKNFRIFDGKVY